MPTPMYNVHGKYELAWNYNVIILLQSITI